MTINAILTIPTEIGDVHYNLLKFKCKCGKTLLEHECQGKLLTPVEISRLVIMLVMGVISNPCNHLRKYPDDPCHPTERFRWKGNVLYIKDVPLKDLPRQINKHLIQIEYDAGIRHQFNVCQYDDYSKDTSFFRCSACKHVQPKQNRYGSNNEFKYCPSCGQTIEYITDWEIN